jgi:hypothetical protein
MRGTRFYSHPTKPAEFSVLLMADGWWVLVTCLFHTHPQPTDRPDPEAGLRPDFGGVCKLESFLVAYLRVRRYVRIRVLAFVVRREVNFFFFFLR